MGFQQVKIVVWLHIATIFLLNAGIVIMYPFFGAMHPVSCKQRACFVGVPVQAQPGFQRAFPVSEDIHVMQTCYYGEIFVETMFPAHEIILCTQVYPEIVQTNH